jgi:hypothetical protein
MKLFLITGMLFWACNAFSQALLPIAAQNRHSIEELRLTEIGAFGVRRKAQPNVKSHLHAGIDIRRPGINYEQNPVFAVAPGSVISVRDDGPYAKIIIEHQIDGESFWSVYEHISGIRVQPGDVVKPEQPIARFMNRTELDNYGWQFDHFHLEILKVPPLQLRRNPKLPGYRFNSYTLMCFSEQELSKYFFDPMFFFKTHLSSDAK